MTAPRSRRIRPNAATQAESRGRRRGNAFACPRRRRICFRWPSRLLRGDGDGIRLLQRLQPRINLLREQREISHRIVMRHRPRMAHHQKIGHAAAMLDEIDDLVIDLDRKSTRLNSSHLVISYAVFCLKKKKKKILRNTLKKKKQKNTTKKI